LLQALPEQAGRAMPAEATQGFLGGHEPDEIFFTVQLECRGPNGAIGGGVAMPASALGAMASKSVLGCFREFETYLAAEATPRQWQGCCHGLRQGRDIPQRLHGLAVAHRGDGIGRGIFRHGLIVTTMRHPDMLDNDKFTSLVETADGDIEPRATGLPHEELAPAAAAGSPLQLRR